jgi:hypothetical protein
LLDREPTRGSDFVIAEALSGHTPDCGGDLLTAQLNEVVAGSPF